MNILIVGGRKKADFLAESLLEKKHMVTLINKDREFCEKLIEKYDTPIICGDGTKAYMLEQANIENFDVVIAITPYDSKNLVICELSKSVYKVKKTFATVTNPKNVDIFKQLGIDGAISATHSVSNIIETLTTINDIHKFVSIEEGKLSMIDIYVKSNYEICDKYIKNINFSDKGIIGCIIRDSQSIIPKGNTRIKEGDKLIILSHSYEIQSILNKVREER